MSKRGRQQRRNREKSEEAIGKGRRERAFGDGLHDGGKRAATAAGRAQLDAVGLRQDHDSLMDLLPPLDLQ